MSGFCFFSVSSDEREKVMSQMLEYMRAGGSIMWVIAAMSIAALAVAVERLIFFYRASADAEAVERDLGATIDEDNIERALSVAQSSDSSLHRLFLAALNNWDSASENMKLITEQQIRREVFRWEKHFFLLEITGKTAPLLGLLGTVLGMVEMFQSLHMGGQISAQAVTGGIWKALFTTVAGLTVAIPAILAHGFLVSRVDSEEEKLNRGADWLIRKHFAGRGR